jgi:hypothetical protein
MNIFTIILLLLITIIVIFIGLYIYDKYKSLIFSNLDKSDTSEETNNLVNTDTSEETNNLVNTDTSEETNNNLVNLIYIIKNNNDSIIDLSSKELLRYIYLITGKSNIKIINYNKNNELNGKKLYLFLKNDIPERFKETIKYNLNKKNEYGIKNINNDEVIIVGFDNSSLLLGVYRFAELLGISYGLHGDVIPDDKTTLNFSNIDEVSSPQFNVQGILPWHDFPGGPDLWSYDDYFNIISQSRKLGMNFFGLHTYTKYNSQYDQQQDFSRGPEPNVWIGLPEDMDEKGNSLISYPSTYFTTHSKTWGYSQMGTNEFHAGASELFETNRYGSEIIGSKIATNMNDYNNIFKRAARVFRSAFQHAKNIGVLTASGTELPMGVEKAGGEIESEWVRGIPIEVQNRLIKKGKNPKDPETIREIYKGIFTYIMKNYHLDYYWLWNYEIWSTAPKDGGGWVEDVTEEQKEAILKDINIAIDVLKELGNPFKLALAGWLLGTFDNPAAFDNRLPKDMPFYSLMGSAIGYEKLDEKRVKWPGTYFAYDRDLTQFRPSLFSIHEDITASIQKKCTGMIAKMWRTRINSINCFGFQNLSWKRGKCNSVKLNDNLVESDEWIEMMYIKWAKLNFGKNSSSRLGTILADMEMSRNGLDMIVGWDGRDKTGYTRPGAIMLNSTPWEIESKKYNFVKEFKSLQHTVKGKGNLERFNYWLTTLELLKRMAEFGCERYLFEKAMMDKDYIIAEGMIIRLLFLFMDIIILKIKKITDISELGEIINLENLTWKQTIEEQWLDKLEKGLGRKPNIPKLDKKYGRDSILRIVNHRNTIYKNENPSLKLIGLLIKNPTLHINVVGENKFKSFKFTNVNNAIYRCKIPEEFKNNNCIEYYVTAKDIYNTTIYYPSSAPETNNTIIIV